MSLRTEAGLWLSIGGHRDIISFDSVLRFSVTSRVTDHRNSIICHLGEHDTDTQTLLENGCSPGIWGRA